MKNFYARKLEGKYQLLEEHLNNVSILSERFSKFKNIAGIAGYLHDIGKLTPKFQGHLQNKSKGVIHSHQASYIIEKWPLINRFSPLLKEILKLITATHHGSLPDIVSVDGEKVFFDKFCKEREQDLGVDFLEEIRDEGVFSFPKDIDEKYKSAARELEFFFELIAKDDFSLESAKFALGLLVKYLYSILIDSDRLDAYLFEVDSEYLPVEAKWDEIIELFEEKLKELTNSVSKSKIQKLREKVSAQCKDAANERTNIYCLSVPTGGGKTLSSFRFALHHLKLLDKKRIIYVIPYLSIIEQTAFVFRNILDLADDSEVLLEHHSDIAETNDEEGEKKAKLAAERWDSPIIITTLVQFLETLMSSKASKLRKFHNMADSVIIFDEIQSLPNHSIDLFNEIITFLTKFMGTTILLCTATQPSLTETEKGNLKLPPNFNIVEDIGKSPEIIERTEIIVEKPKDFRDYADFILEKALENINCLVIVNTKKAARELYIKIADSYEGQIFHLSTSMCSQHRKDTIKEIMAALKKGEKFLCISTQLIEAGVDISFSIVVRSLAGLDSILQAAGRCNRHGEYEKKCPVYVVPYIDDNLERLKEIKYGREVTDRLIRENPKINLYEEAVLKKYYEYYYEKTKRIMSYPTDEGVSVYNMLSTNTKGVVNYENINGVKYPLTLSHAFDLSSKYYKTIDSDTETVVVYYGESENLLYSYENATCLKEKLTLLKKLKKYTISLYKGAQIQRMVEEGMIRMFDDDFGIMVLERDMYCHKTGCLQEAYMKNIIV